MVKGYRNTNYLYDIVNGRWNRLKIKIIKEKNCNWIEDEEQMVTGAIEWYKNQFSIEEESTSQDILQHVPCVVTQEDSDLLSHMITMEEVK